MIHIPDILLKFIYSEKAAKFCEIFPLLLTTVHTVKSKGKNIQTLKWEALKSMFNTQNMTNPTIVSTVKIWVKF